MFELEEFTEARAKERLGITDRLVLRIPCSVSNMGPGLDTLALALNARVDLCLELSATPDASFPLVRFRVDGHENRELDSSTKVVTSLARLIWGDRPEILQRMRIAVACCAPISRGMGTGDAIMAGLLWSSFRLKGLIPTKTQILSKGSQLLGYSERIAASLLGNLVVCGSSRTTHEALAEQLNWPRRWSIIMVVPEREIDTELSRDAIPDQVTIADTLSNLQNTALFVAAVARNNEMLLRDCLFDRLHENQRLSLVPELGKLRKLLLNEPVIGSVLSGGGPGMAVIVNEHKKHSVLEAIGRWVASETAPFNVFDLHASDSGLEELEAELKLQ